ncbi:MAG: NlpC/P60 family protein [Oscillospiraceae bacterium]|nr:NlpC/P60 family protein [Oscillospiraceae bacterium]
MKRISVFMLAAIVALGVFAMTACNDDSPATPPEFPTSPEAPTPPEAPADPENPTPPEAPTLPEAPTEPETPESLQDPEPPIDPETPQEPTADFVFTDTREGIVETAKSLLGTPFAEDGESPEEGFDNSGFIYYVMTQNGFENFPRGLGAEAQTGTQITNWEDLEPGDILFFNEEHVENVSADTPHFGGIYIGGGKIIACLHEDDVVKEIDVLQEWWHDAFVFATDLF